MASAHDKAMYDKTDEIATGGLGRAQTRERVLEHVTSRMENNNVAAKLRNPLAGIPRETLMADVEEFAEQKGLTEHLPILKKGALLAQNPREYDSMPELTAEEKAIIDREHKHRWSHPKMLYFTIALCSIGAAVQGWDQEGINGANLSFPQEFNIASTSRHDTLVVGLINSAPYLASACCGCWLSDPLNRLFGRRGVIFITALILLATPIGSAFTHSWQTLLAVRLILGVGMGAKGSTVPILAAENAPANIRGALVMTWQFWTAFGIFLGVLANVICLAFPAHLQWRYQLASAFIPAIPLMCIYLVPESPRWLMKKNRYPQAFQSLVKLRHSPLQAARDLYYVHVQLELEAQVVKADSYFRRFCELWTIPRNRRATLAASTVMLAQQMCGINIIAFYSSTVFVESGATNHEALFASLGFGAINFLFAFPAFWTIDTYGRRTLLLFTFPNMAWSLLVAGLGFLIPKEHKNTRLGVIATFIYIFAAFYSPGEGPVPFAYSAEVFPLSHREVGMAWAVTVCLGFAFVLGITFPLMLVAMGSLGAFCFYAGLNVIAFILLFLFMPETKQRTLEELDQVFSVPTSVFIKYNTQKALPYWFSRYVFCNKRATLEPLYTFEDDLAGGNDARRAYHTDVRTENEFEKA